jgi:allantoinase
MLTEGYVHRQAPLHFIAGLVSQRVVERFKLPGTKGRIAVGCDADLVLVDLEREFQVKLEDLFYRHRQTPYVGRKLHGRVVRTLARGRAVFKDGQTGTKPLGRLVKPLR